MIKLLDAANDKQIGTLTEEQLETLRSVLVEESDEDAEYYITVDTIDLLEENGADPALLEILRSGLGGREEMDIRWEQGD